MVYLDSGDGFSWWYMERLSDKNLETILRYARRHGMVILIGLDGELKGYPKTSPVFSKVRDMLVDLHPEMKMHIIRTTREGENPCQFS